MPLVGTDDHMIPPAVQRQMAQRGGAEIVQVSDGSAVYVSHPEQVAGLIERQHWRRLNRAERSREAG
jgi:hypothetical protein